MDYLTWTYFYRRLVMNPSYYGLSDTSEEDINNYLSELVEDSIWQLCQSGCVEVGEDGLALEPEILGRIASYYYLDHKTLRLFSKEIVEDMNIPSLLKVRRRLGIFVYSVRVDSVAPPLCSSCVTWKNMPSYPSATTKTNSTRTLPSNVSSL